MHIFMCVPTYVYFVCNFLYVAGPVLVINRTQDNDSISGSGDSTHIIIVVVVLLVAVTGGVGVAVVGTVDV